MSFFVVASVAVVIWAFIAMLIATCGIHQIRNDQLADLFIVAALWPAVSIIFLIVGSLQAIMLLVFRLAYEVKMLLWRRRHRRKPAAPPVHIRVSGPGTPTGF